VITQHNISSQKDAEKNKKELEKLIEKQKKELENLVEKQTEELTKKLEENFKIYDWL